MLVLSDYKYAYFFSQRRCCSKNALVEASNHIDSHTDPVAILPKVPPISSALPFVLGTFLAL